MFLRRRTLTLTNRDLRPILQDLRSKNDALAWTYPGEPATRQPVHTVYGGAHLFRAGTAQKLGAAALSVLEEYAPDEQTFAEALGLYADEKQAAGDPPAIREKVVEKLRTEPVEDYRIDFEDGYGTRPDDEEDGHARSAAGEVASGYAAGTLPPFIGIRIKPMSREGHARGLRTLDLFLTTLVRSANGGLPSGFVVTIPKVMSPGHVSAVSRACAALERRLKLTEDSIRIELMIETPQAILGPDGTSTLLRLVEAGEGRVTGAHFGTFDYTALCGITAAWQDIRHQACDFARNMMQVALAQTAVRLSDSVTTIMPVPPHREVPGTQLTETQRRANAETVHRAWKEHAGNVRHSLINGYYQGWDLHPAQLPARYGAVYAFFQSARPAATARLRTFVEGAAQAMLVGDVFDDEATGQGLLNFFVRGLNSGAIGLAEAQETGLSAEELQGRSFRAIVEGRRP